VYAISLVLLLAAVVTLAIGFVQGGLTLIFVSIGASIASAVFLAAGVLRRRPLQPATAGAPYGPAEGTPAAATATTERPRAPLSQRRPAAAPPAGKPSEAPRPKEPVKAEKTTGSTKTTTKKAAAKKPAAKKAVAKKPAAKKTAAKRTAATGGQVVSLPERGTYHTAGCRFVKGKRDTEKITKATAKRRGYDACGVCKPDA